MPLNDLQEAFLKNILVSKNGIIDPETGSPVDWDALGGGGLSESEVQDLIDDAIAGLPPSSTRFVSIAKWGTD